MLFRQSHRRWEAVKGIGLAVAVFSSLPVRRGELGVAGTVREQTTGRCTG